MLLCFKCHLRFFRGRAAAATVTSTFSSRGADFAAAFAGAAFAAAALAGAGAVAALAGAGVVRLGLLPLF